MGLNRPRRLGLLLVSGSLRSESTNTAVLRTLAAVAPDGVDCRIDDSLAKLPPFNPDADRPPLAPEVRDLRHAIHGADAVVFSTPEYAGALPGSFKNLLDWTIGDDHAGSIDDKPVGWVNASTRGAVGAYGELRTVLGYAHARIVGPACVRVPVTTAMIGPGGLIDDEASRAALLRAVVALADGATRLEASRSARWS